MSKQTALLRSMALTIRKGCNNTASSAIPGMPAAMAVANLGVSADRWGTHGLLLQGTPYRQLHQLPGAPPPKDIDPESPWNIPNMLSLARGASGPAIAYLIVNEHWAPACAAVVISGATDWLDGYIARRMGLNSVLGSYLDPLGDKLLICSVALALAAKGLIPTWVVVVVVGRDVALVAGTVVHRWQSLGWRTVSLREFLQTRAPASSDRSGPQAGAAAATQARHSEDAEGGQQERQSFAAMPASDGSSASSQADAGVPVMRPLMISKANTVLQLSLIAGYLSKAWVAWPDPDSLHVLELATAATTGASCLAYAHKFWSRG